MNHKSIEQFLNDMLQNENDFDTMSGVPQRSQLTILEFSKGYLDRSGVNIAGHHKRMGLPKRPANEPIPKKFEVEREGRKRKQDTATGSMSRQREREKEVQWQRIENERRRKAQLKKADKFKREMDRRDRDRAQQRGLDR